MFGSLEVACKLLAVGYGNIWGVIHSKEDFFFQGVEQGRHVEFAVNEAGEEEELSSSDRPSPRLFRRHTPHPYKNKRITPTKTSDMEKVASIIAQVRNSGIRLFLEGTSFKLK